MHSKFILALGLSLEGKIWAQNKIVGSQFSDFFKTPEKNR